MLHSAGLNSPRKGSSARCIVLTLALAGWSAAGGAAVYAQTSGGPRPEGLVPRSVGFLSAYRLHLNAIRTLGNGDRSFAWDSDIGADLDLFDLGFVRGNLFVNIESILGDERRAIDPNQNNYTIDTTIFVRLPRGTLGATFHHISRHLADRENKGAVAWNMAGLNYADRFRFGPVDLYYSGAAYARVLRAGVDYESEFNARVRLAYPADGRVALILDLDGTAVGVTRRIYNRPLQHGHRFESGLRIRGRAGTAELVFGRERRIDADPFERRPIEWSRFGFRFVVG